MSAKDIVLTRVLKFLAGEIDQLRLARRVFQDTARSPIHLMAVNAVALAATPPPPDVSYRRYTLARMERPERHVHGNESGHCKSYQDIFQLGAKIHNRNASQQACIQSNRADAQHTFVVASCDG